MANEEHAGAFKMHEIEHEKMFFGIFPGVNLYDFDSPEEEPKGSDYLTELKESKRIKDKSIIHRKITEIRERLGPTTRIQFMNWVIGENFRCILWGQNLVILCDNDIVIRHPRRDLKLQFVRGRPRRPSTP